MGQCRKPLLEKVYTEGRISGRLQIWARAGPGPSRFSTTAVGRRLFLASPRWLREHQPAIFEHPFPSTSISVNHGYAARKHRDAYNSGPSMTKAFGLFEGGRLLYWPTLYLQNPIGARSTNNTREGLLPHEGYTNPRR